VRATLAGCDVCVVMPTGGGKSLCYQLPAAVMPERTAIVVSPLIALMQDQAAQLAQMGLPAAVLNSVQAASEQSAVMRKAARGEYRLLYLSPERLARAETLDWLRQVPVGFFAIDEAHCISEWGHEFRPDYRQLRRLREQFPDRPIAGFTASATRPVRHDIMRQLQLRDPATHIASFHRANLRYLVRECQGGEAAQLNLLLTALRMQQGSNVIVYAPTIKRVEQTVDFLEEAGMAAVPYHGQMDGETRRRNQERWMNDEVRVLVGTIAFGLGINKASVRAVIHLSLPKSVEQYYQEAGRAGRDGRPADCLLLWQPRDSALLSYFIEQISDADEKARCWQRYRDIHDFVRRPICRHRQVCLHFGETPKWTACGNCDVCTPAPLWLRMNDAPPARKQPTLAIGVPAEVQAASPADRGGPLKPGVGKTGDLDIDPELWDYMREWRRDVAKQEKVAAFVVLHDTSLEALCRARPKSIAELRGVTGFGERKTERYGAQVLAALECFRNGARAENKPPMAASVPLRETLKLLEPGSRSSRSRRCVGGSFRPSWTRWRNSSSVARRS
jgi:ATP-dependent DNA helicase RecQ